MFCESCQFSGICPFSAMRCHGAIEHLPQALDQEGAVIQFRVPRLFFQMSGHTTWVPVLFPHHLTEPLGLYPQPSYTASSAHRSLENHTLYVILQSPLLLSDLSGPLGLPSFEMNDQSSNPLSICWLQRKWLVLAIRVCLQLFHPIVPITLSGLRCHS